MRKFTWEDLVDKTENELLLIKKSKQEELYEVKNRKLTIVANIMSLQGMIQTEIQGIANLKRSMQE